MKRNKKKKENLRGAVSSILFLIILISILSFILNVIGFQGYKTSIVNGVLADTLVKVRNVFSVEGIRFVIGDAITNFMNFEPLVLLIISLIGIGICEKSGFLNILLAPLKKFKFGIIVYLTIIISLISSIIGDYSYVFLIPLTAVVYKYLNRNPMLGIMISFLSITLGYGTGLIFNYGDYNLGLLTETAAVVDVDPAFSYNLTSTTYIMVASTLILSFILYIAVTRFLVLKFPIKSKNDEELNETKKGFALAMLAGIISTCLVIYMIIDVDLPFAGILLDKSNDVYVAKLFGENSPFREGIVVIISLIMMISGFVYGKISGNIKNSSEYSLGLSKNFENLGLLFVLMFFMSQLVSLLDWTNIGVVVASNLISFMSNLQFSGILLIITFILVIIVMSLFIPDTYTKWELSSPVVVPLFMRANIAPQFTQFVFAIADSIGKAFSPIFIYFIVTIAFLQKYNTDDKKQISIFNTFKLMLPVILIVTLFWLVFISLWFLIGFPIGLGVFTTL